MKQLAAVALSLLVWHSSSEAQYLSLRTGPGVFVGQSPWPYSNDISAPGFQFLALLSTQPEGFLSPLFQIGYSRGTSVRQAAIDFVPMHVGARIAVGDATRRSRCLLVEVLAGASYYKSSYGPASPRFDTGVLASATISATAPLRIGEKWSFELGPSFYLTESWGRPSGALPSMTTRSGFERVAMHFGVGFY